MKLKTTRARVLLAKLKKRSRRINHGTREELIALARSWLANPIHSILVRASDLAIADGHRRVLGLEMVGETEAEVEQLEGDISDRDLDRMAMVSAYHRSPLGGYEQAYILRDMTEAEPGVTNKDLAEEMQIDGSMPTRLLSLFDCIPEVQEAAKAGKIGVTVWYTISRSADQLAALQAALSGSSRDELQRENRKQKNGNGKAATVTAKTIPVVLGNGLAVTFKAENVSLSMALDALADIKQVLKDAIDDDHDARTFTALMKKRAKQLAKGGA